MKANKNISAILKQLESQQSAIKTAAKSKAVQASKAVIKKFLWEQELH